MSRCFSATPPIVPESRAFFDRLHPMEDAVESRIVAAIDSLPTDLGRPIGQWFERLAEQQSLSSISDENVTSLVRLVACSEFGATVILKDWRWFVDSVESFNGETDLEADLAVAGFADELEIDALKSVLRRFRHRAMLRILWREVAGLASLDETLGKLSELADLVLDVATRHVVRALQPRYGSVRDSAGQTVPLVILGMGKLGGNELNFSSDIDLIFLFTEDGQSDGARCLSAQEYFVRLTRLIVALIDEVTMDGIVFRIDTRLRPFGASGPPVVSFAALESYLLQHGRDWERYAYVKARIVGPKPETAVQDELYGNLIMPFVYRRYLDYGVFESLRKMHAMIAAEVRRRELADNVKLGPGGIREAEFIVQSFQLVRGGSEEALQGRELQAVLPKLVSSRGLSAQGARRLRRAYRFLRRVENFIQAIRDQQTHDLPDNATDRARLCVAMGYTDWDDLRSDLEAHRSAISLEFERIAFRGDSDDRPLRQQFASAWESNANERQWRDLLQDTGLSDAADLAMHIVAFANAPATQQIDSVASARLQRFMSALILELSDFEKPVSALTRTLGVIERILRRSAYLSLLNENRAAMTRLVDLCGRSRYIAKQIALHPVLLDELLDPQVYSSTVTKADLSAELRHRLTGIAEDDSEMVMQSIVQYQSATKFRIAVADFTGTLPIMKVSDGLTWLAESVLEEALRVAWHDLTARYGAPCYVVDGVRHEAATASWVAWNCRMPRISTSSSCMTRGANRV